METMGLIFASYVENGLVLADGPLLLLLLFEEDLIKTISNGTFSSS